MINKQNKLAGFALPLFLSLLFISALNIQKSYSIPEPPMTIYGAVKSDNGQLLSSGQLNIAILNEAQQVVQQFQTNVNTLADGVNLMARLPMEFSPNAQFTNPNALATNQNYFLQITYNDIPATIQSLSQPFLTERGKTVGPLDIIVPLEGGSPPSIISINPTSAQLKIGETITVQLIAEDADQDQLTVSTIPSGSLTQVGMMQVGERITYDFQFTATQNNIGQNQITINVSDGILQDSTTITLTVTDGDGLIEPSLVYEFDQSSLAQSGWTEVPGGFVPGTEPASHTLFNFSLSPDLLPSSEDKKGLTVSNNPSEVFFAFASESIQTNNQAILLRLTARAGSPDSQIALVALKGNLALGQADGSIAYHIPFNTSQFISQEQHINLIYEPDDSSPITPAIQVASSSESSPGAVLIDKLEIFSINDSQDYPYELFDPNIENIPLQANTNLQTDYDFVYEFGESSLDQMGWNSRESFIPGTPTGFVLPFNFTEMQIPSSQDNKGIVVLSRSGDVNFLHLTEAINTQGLPVLIRTTVQADSPNAQVALVVLKGNLSTGQNVDSSIALQIPANTNNMINSEKTLSLLYYPDSGELITPAIQVSGLGEGQQASVYIDRVEVMLLKQNFSFPGHLFRSTTVNE